MKVIRELFSSYKFVTALLSSISLVLLKLGVPELTVVELGTIASPFLVAIGAQGYSERDQKAIEANAIAVKSGR